MVASMSNVSEPILEVRNLHTSFFTSEGEVKAVNGVSFTLERGDILGIVGESGSGKSAMVLSILRLIDEPGRITFGQILFKGRDILEMSGKELRAIRGKDIAMIFPEPETALNPTLRVGLQVAEAVFSHMAVGRRAAFARGLEVMQEVRIPSAASRLRSYPHQFSGGMRQRVVIAMGLANEPSILIADEATTALDVTVQAQVLDLLRDLKRRRDMAIIAVTHNMGVVAGLCTRVIVMYAGQIVEAGSVTEVLRDPQHPYTWLLMRAMPRVDSDRGQPLAAIAGAPPDLAANLVGCKFSSRCPFRIARCVVDEPPLTELGDGHRAACWVTMNRALKK